MCPVGDPLGRGSSKGHAQPISGRAPPEGALDLKVLVAGPPRVGVGTGGLVHTGVSAENQRKESRASLRSWK